MTLEEAIRIGLDNSEVVRVIALGAQGIPVSGFEPSPLNVSGAVGNALGAGTLNTVYDPAIQETQIAQALSQFDASIQSQLFWSHSAQPFNNAIQTGFFAATRFPVIGIQDSINFNAALQKRTATGATLSVQQNAVYTYSNNPNNVFPSVWTPNLQFRFNQPLLGSAPNQFNGQPGPSGLEANRAPIVIARLNADASIWRFKAEIMNMVRSVEQQYWALAQAQLQYWASETAVTLGEQILRRERAKYEVGSGSLRNVAEAEEQLERFRLDYIEQTANLLTTERQLRNILGLPPADNRRILPVTAPTDARIEPDWESSLGQMVAYQPDIVQNQLLVRIAELQLLVARNQLLPVLAFDLLYQLNGFGKDLDEAMGVMTGKTVQAIDPILQFQQRQAGLNPQPGTYGGFQTWQAGITFQMPLGYRGPLANTRQAQFSLLRQRAYLQQVVHQQAHFVARFFLEVDKNYKQFKTASRLKAAALQRLEAQKAYYENGTITIDQYLDSVNRWAQAVTFEAQYRAQYNIAIAALEESKGTLLAYNNIILAEGPWPAKAYVQARDQRVAHRRTPVGDDGNLSPRPQNMPLNSVNVPPQPPENAGPSTIQPLPAPAGPLGPQPIPAGPTLPVGEPPVVSDATPTPGTPMTTPPTEPVSDVEAPVAPPDVVVPAAIPETETSGDTVVPAASATSDSSPGAPEAPRDAVVPASTPAEMPVKGAATVDEKTIELPPLPAPLPPDMSGGASGSDERPPLDRALIPSATGGSVQPSAASAGEVRVELLPPLPEPASEPTTMKSNGRAGALAVPNVSNAMTKRTVEGAKVQVGMTGAGLPPLPTSYQTKIATPAQGRDGGLPPLPATSRSTAESTTDLPPLPASK
jgi:outer membrane protein TolC